MSPAAAAGDIFQLVVTVIAVAFQPSEQGRHRYFSFSDKAKLERFSVLCTHVVLYVDVAHIRGNEAIEGKYVVSVRPVAVLYVPEYSEVGVVFHLAQYRGNSFSGIKVSVYFKINVYPFFFSVFTEL